MRANRQTDRETDRQTETLMTIPALLLGWSNIILALASMRRLKSGLR